MLTVVVENLSQTGPVWWIPLALGLRACWPPGARPGQRRGQHGPAWRRPADALAASPGSRRGARRAIALSLWSLSVALVGFSWDVAWHADLGRDQALFTPPHVMILVGLAGIGLSALTVDHPGHRRSRPRRGARSAACACPGRRCRWA